MADTDRVLSENDALKLFIAPRKTPAALQTYRESFKDINLNVSLGNAAGDTLASALMRQAIRDEDLPTLQYLVEKKQVPINIPLPLPDSRPAQTPLDMITRIKTDTDNRVKVPQQFGRLDPNGPEVKRVKAIWDYISEATKTAPAYTPPPKPVRTIIDPDLHTAANASDLEGKKSAAAAKSAPAPAGPVPAAVVPETIPDPASEPLPPASAAGTNSNANKKDKDSNEGLFALLAAGAALVVGLLTRIPPIFTALLTAAAGAVTYFVMKPSDEAKDAGATLSSLTPGQKNKLEDLGKLIEKAGANKLGVLIKLDMADKDTSGRIEAGEMRHLLETEGGQKDPKVLDQFVTDFEKQFPRGIPSRIPNSAPGK